MRRTVNLLLILAVLWALLSGETEPLLVGLGLASCVLVVAISRRMDVIDREGQSLHLHPLRFLRYALWLLKEIIKSNLTVTRRILHPRLPIRPSVFGIETHGLDEIGQVIYANSITLTPGTVSIDVVDGVIEIHALDSGSATKLREGEMERRIRALGGFGPASEC